MHARGVSDSRPPHVPRGSSLRRRSRSADVVAAVASSDRSHSGEDHLSTSARAQSDSHDSTFRSTSSSSGRSSGDGHARWRGRTGARSAVLRRGVGPSARRDRSRMRRAVRTPVVRERDERPWKAKGHRPCHGTHRKGRCRLRDRRGRSGGVSGSRAPFRRHSPRDGSSCTLPRNGRAAATCGSRCKRHDRRSTLVWDGSLRGRGMCQCSSSCWSRSARRVPRRRGRTRPPCSRSHACRRAFRRQAGGDTSSRRSRSRATRSVRRARDERDRRLPSERSMDRVADRHGRPHRGTCCSRRGPRATCDTWRTQGPPVPFGGSPRVVDLRLRGSCRTHPHRLRRAWEPIAASAGTRRDFPPSADLRTHLDVLRPRSGCCRLRPTMRGARDRPKSPKTDGRVGPAPRRGGPALIHPAGLQGRRPSYSRPRPSTSRRASCVQDLRGTAHTAPRRASRRGRGTGSPTRESERFRTKRGRRRRG
jgi:hypothetical protein